MPVVKSLELKQRCVRTYVCVVGSCTYALRHTGDIQWNLSMKHATRTQLSVLYREVPLIQR